MPEVRVDVQPEELTVIDAYCMAHGIARVDLVKKLIRKFTNAEVHASKMILRSLHINPLVSDSDRRPSHE